MKKSAAAKKTTTAGDGVQQYMEALDAKRMFLGATANMSWRLAITVLIPIIGGVKLDDHFHSSPSYTLTGFIIAAFAGCTAVWSTIKEINREQVVDEKQSTKSKRKRRIKSV